MKLFLTFVLLIFSSCNLLAEETFIFIGNFDNVKATETGHCYGEGISLWRLQDNKVIGLLNIAQGLCGDPACSAIEGNINDETVTFNSLLPIYNQTYKFEGVLNGLTLSGLINDNNVILKKDSMSQRHKTKSEWCSTWSKISRCQGVSNICK